MKFKYQVLTISLIVLSYSLLCAQDFITKWTSTSPITYLSFSGLAVDSVNYSWTASPSGYSGSGSFKNDTSGVIYIEGLNGLAHDTLTINMSPNNLRRFYFVGGDDYGKLIDVAQWGAVSWSSMDSAFNNCYNLANFTASDVPDLSNVKDMSYMFYRAYTFNGNIGNWNTANVTNMSYMFSQASTFNGNIGNWNTANVTNMAAMFFLKTQSFNQDIGNWNTAKVTDMHWMFYGATRFNQNIGTWTLNSSVYIELMLNHSGLDCNNYSATLIGWQVNNPTVTGRNLGTTGGEYGTNAVAARNALINTQGWIIRDDHPSGTDCSVVSVHNTPSIETMIFPNPVNDLVIMVSSETGTMTMSDMYGRIINTLYIVEGKNEINIGQLPGGFYFFTINNGNRYKILKE